ncbi:MAG: DUF707 domain-containing protein [Balneolaceae bacterium]|nr:DUF707 domain-containing protein [Balneolaceae bacterium]MDR9409219.1 DUF707 domain-containing protein [Balneolaceae bacterium]
MGNNKNTDPRPSHPYCVISAVGEKSKHPVWISENSRFDLHLIVYDDSIDKYDPDTPFIKQSKGYKYNLIYDYLKENEDFLNHYEYFYMPDDDIIIKPEAIQRLFSYMKRYNLSIAQPALINKFYSYPHTCLKLNSNLRYTNFVEIMQPCFSREALKKTLFTFKENKSGWGMDFHWGDIVDYKQKNMAIIDDVMSFHSRPVQSKHFDELQRYIEKYNLTKEVYESI